MNDPISLLAFALVVVFIAAAVMRRIDWFAAALGIVSVLLFLALFGNHWQG